MVSETRDLHPITMYTVKFSQWRMSVHPVEGTFVALRIRGIHEPFGSTLRRSSFAQPHIVNLGSKRGVRWFFELLLKNAATKDLERIAFVRRNLARFPNLTPCLLCPSCEGGWHITDETIDATEFCWRCYFTKSGYKLWYQYSCTNCHATRVEQSILDYTGCANCTAKTNIQRLSMALPANITVRVKGA